MRDSPPHPIRRQWLSLALGAGAALAGGAWLPGSAAAATPAAGLAWRERRLQGLGTDLSLRAAHREAAQADAALDAAVAAIRHVERQFSLFDPDSALVRLNRDGHLAHPHPDFVHLMRLAKAISAQSGGSFDVTVQPLWAVWQDAKTQGRLPTRAELTSARARIGWQGVDIRATKVRFLKPGMAATLNGIAQGFAADLATAALRAHGIEHALLDTGEWRALGQSPEAGPWRLGVANPRANDGDTSAHPIAALTLAPDDGWRAVATSSDAHYRFGADDQHHHILDPATGDSPRLLASVTVMAPTCVMADALTKVMFMADLPGALALARRWQVGVLAVDKTGRWAASEGLAGRLSKS